MEQTKFDKESQKPLYRQLADEIRRQIRDGEILPGQKLMSESEMLKKYGVGRLTIRNALQLLVSEGLLKKSQGKGTFCAEAEERKDLNVQVFLNMTDTYFIPYYVRGISEVLSRSNSNFLISDTRDDDMTLCALLENVTPKNSSGVIVQCTDECLNDEVSERITGIMRDLSDSGIPVIILDGRLNDVNVSCFTLDEIAGGMRAAEHLAAFGHKKCAFLNFETHRDSRLRFRGFAGGAVKYQMEKPLEISCKSEWESEILRAVKDGITGIFAYNDNAALRCIMALKKEGYGVPEDVSVLGFDDTYLALACDPQLTSLIHPKEQMGRDAAEALLTMLATGNTIPVEKKYKTELMIRDSTGPAKKARVTYEKLSDI